MRSNQRSPILPYLGVLACLFALAVFAPRSWKSDVGRRSERTTVRSSGSKAAPRVVHREPKPEVVPVATAAATPVDIVQTPQLDFGDDMGLEPIPAAVAERIGDQRQFDTGAELALVPNPPNDPELESPAPTPIGDSEEDAPDLELPNFEGSGLEPPFQEPTVAQSETDRSGDVAQTTGPAWWPAPQSLLRRLEALAQRPASRMWASEARRLILELGQASSPHDSAVQRIVADLRTLNGRGRQIVSDQHAAELAAEIRRARYALARRLDIWEAIAEPDSSIASVGNPLHRASVETNEAQALLTAIEQYENGCLPSRAVDLAAQIRQLIPTGQVRENSLEHRLHLHYRNANLRIAVAGELLNLALPQPGQETDRVVDTVVGVPVRGHSTTLTQLQLRLLPHRSQLRFGLEALGDVDSLTRATSGPVTFTNAGDASFMVRKLIVVDQNGVRVKQAQAHARSSSDIARLETSFDAIPLVSDLVRSYALSEHESKKWQAQREVESKVAARAASRFDSEANAKLIQAQQQFRERTAKLSNLELALTPIELQTTAERLQMRLRLSGSDQLGAHTARPRAPGDSLASLQIHQTVMNNFIERLDLNGRTFAVRELHGWVSEKLQRPLPALPDDSPDDVVVTFAAEDAIVLRCDDGLLEINLAFARLKHDRKSWRDFGIRAMYRPAPAGMELLWERDGTVELTGERYQGRTEFGLRGILSKIFPKDRPLNLTPAEVVANPGLAGLAITQCVADDGWVGVAVGRSRRPAESKLSLEAKSRSPQMR